MLRIVNEEADSDCVCVCVRHKHGCVYVYVVCITVCVCCVCCVCDGVCPIGMCLLLLSARLPHVLKGCFDTCLHVFLILCVRKWRIVLHNAEGNSMFRCFCYLFPLCNGQIVLGQWYWQMGRLPWSVVDTSSLWLSCALNVSEKLKIVSVTKCKISNVLWGKASRAPATSFSLQSVMLVSQLHSKCQFY